jgi:hypothetical protein
VDAFDDEHAVLLLDLAGGLSDESSFRGVDLARLQRASERAGQSASGCGDDVVERRRVLGLAATWDTVVVGNLVMNPEEDRLKLGWNGRSPQRTADTFDSDQRDIRDLAHAASSRL